MVDNESPDPRQALRDYINQFQEARKALAKASEVTRRIEGLAKELTAKTPGPFPGVDAESLNRLVHSTPEQQKIESIRQSLRDAEWKVRNLRDEVRRVLGFLALRDGVAKSAAGEFDRLSPYSTLSNVDTIIGLLREVMAEPETPQPAPGQRGTTKATEDWRHKATLAAQEAAAVLQYSRRHIYTLVQDGKLKVAVMTGKKRTSIRILRESVESMLKEK